MEKRHILICGERQVGKSTLIEKLIKELEVPVYGFLTRMAEPDERGIRSLYMYSPTDTQRKKTPQNHAGDSDGKKRSVNLPVFENLGLELLSPRPGVVVMDELGVMETASESFCQRVMEHLNGENHVIAAVKAKFGVQFLDTVRAHPKAELYYITPENRDSLYSRLLPVIQSWNKE